MESVKLTAKQQAWIDYYKQGKTATEAARLAGYRGNNHDNIGTENLRKLAKYIKDRESELESPRIADMKEINEFWTAVERGEIEEERAYVDKDTGELIRYTITASLKDRIRAAELRAKVQGAFIERIEIREAESEWFKG